jgi:hypothetical protein
MGRKQVDNPEVRFELKPDQQAHFRLLRVLADLAISPPGNVEAPSENEEAPDANKPEAN